MTGGRSRNLPAQARVREILIRIDELSGQLDKVRCGLRKEEEDEVLARAVDAIDGAVLEARYAIGDELGDDGWQVAS